MIQILKKIKVSRAFEKEEGMHSCKLQLPCFGVLLNDVESLLFLYAFMDHKFKNTELTFLFFF